MPNLIEASVPEFEKAIAFLDEELHGLRSGRAQSGLVERIPVEAYGNTMELRGVASITVPDAKTIQIEPWDKGLVKDIEKALVQADLGMQPVTSGTTIRLIMPAMTEENRKRLVKSVHEKAEEARITVRNVRERVRDEIVKQEKEKAMSEDDKFRFQEDLDKRVKAWNDRIEEMARKKEEEIMTI
jgi:ribosome recycling factor